jgi:lipopolysaccharide/colanic/teichoic acid biosynthesis glycosyltransferase
MVANEKQLSCPMKRVFDILAAGTSLVLLSPILAIAALAIRWTSGAPVLFRQIRIGQKGVGPGICAKVIAMIGADHNNLLGEKEKRTSNSQHRTLNVQRGTLNSQH